MIPLDFDMELLRNVGDLRTRLAEMDDPAAQSDLVDGAKGLVDRARGSSPAAVGPLERFHDALAAAAAASVDVRAESVDMLEALEGLIVEGESSEWAAELERRVGALVAVAGQVSGGEGATAGVGTQAAGNAAGAEEAADVEGSAAEDEPADDSLNGVANRLVQMEPTIMESFVALRTHFARAIEGWSGSVEVRQQLVEALEALESVSVDESAESVRIEAVERVGEVLEAAMMEEEELALLRFTGTDADEGAPDVAEAAQPSQEPSSDSIVAGETEPEVADEPVPAAVEAAPAALDSAEADASPSEPEPSPAPVAAAAAQPETAVGDHIVVSEESDPELALDFVAEGLDYLDQAESALLALEADPGDAEAVNVTFRAFHTIKGVSAFLALDQVTDIAHHAETLLAQVRSGTLAFTGTAADLFLRSADVLRALLVGIREVARGGTAPMPAGFAPLMAELTDPEIADKVANDTQLTPAVSKAASERRAKVQDGSSVVTHAEDSVRIRTERLDRLIDLVGELVVAQSMIAQDPEVLGSAGDLGRKVDHSQKILRDLQNLSTSLRMVPLKPAFHKISRVVRDVSQKSGKTVELVATGDDTELDRSMVGIITDPLVHMVRNAVDHGIESAEERVAVGKPEAGTLRLSARQSGGNVVVEIEDDGRGLDREKIFAKAVERGIVDKDRSLDDSEVFNLVFQPGFSTAKEVTDISGRGVGMDVVKRAVESLRGRIEIRSELGQGTRFSIYLPLTLAITDGMLCRIGSQRYIVPTQKILQSFRPTQDDLWTVSKKGEMVMYHDQLIPIARLHRIYQIGDAQEELTNALLVVVGEGSRRTALLVDELLGQQQFVVKALSGMVASTPGVAGGAILGDGAVGLILDPDELVELARNSKSADGKSSNAA